MNKYKLLILLLFIPIISTAQITQSTYRSGNEIYHVPNYSEQQARFYLDNAKELDPVEGIWSSGEDKYSIEKDFDFVKSFFLLKLKVNFYINLKLYSFEKNKIQIMKIC